MKEIPPFLFSHFEGKIEGIVLIDKEDGSIVAEQGDTFSLKEGVGVIGSASEAALKHVEKKLQYINILLKNTQEVIILPHDKYYLGVLHKGEIKPKEIEDFITNYKQEKKIEEKPEEVKTQEQGEISASTVPQSSLEKFLAQKINQVNELIVEFAPDDVVRWGKVVLAKIKDTSPPIASCISFEGNKFTVFFPLSEKINEEDVNKGTKAAIDIIFKMGISRYGVEEARKKLKNVAEKLKIL